MDESRPIIQNFTQIQRILQTPCYSAHAKNCYLQPLYAEAEKTFFFLPRDYSNN